MVRIVQHLHGQGEPLSGVGLVTPYAAQVQLLCSMLRAQLPAVTSDSEPEVKTVDGYQGREKDVIIFSCVRANMQVRCQKLYLYGVK